MAKPSRDEILPVGKGMRRKRGAAEDDDGCGRETTATLAAGAQIQKSQSAGKPPQEAIDASEEIAAQALREKDYSQKALLRALRAVQVPVNTTRKNVMPEGVAAIHGLLLGIYCYGGTIGIAAGTTRHPLLTLLLCEVMRKAAPDFPFTSIQLNYGYASRPHVDKNNLGTSYILGLGDYSGGELWVHDDDGGVPYVLEGNTDVTGYYRVGRELRGEELQIKNTWTVFDGNRLHFTRPFQGERYSIIFFTSDQYASTPPNVREDLNKAGFSFDFENEELQQAKLDKHAACAQLQRTVDRERKELEKQRILQRGRCMGRTWADCWGLRCTAACEESSDFCGAHLLMRKGKERWRTHGRMDGELPKDKHAEMMMCQRRNLKAGKLPPCIEGATILVELTEAQKATVNKWVAARAGVSASAAASGA